MDELMQDSSLEGNLGSNAITRRSWNEQVQSLAELRQINPNIARIITEAIQEHSENQFLCVEEGPYI